MTCWKPMPLDETIPAYRIAAVMREQMPDPQKWFGLGDSHTREAYFGCDVKATKIDTFCRHLGVWYSTCQKIADEFGYDNHGQVGGTDFDGEQFFKQCLCPRKAKMMDVFIKPAEFPTMWAGDKGGFCGATMILGWPNNDGVTKPYDLDEVKPEERDDQ